MSLSLDRAVGSLLVGEAAQRRRGVGGDMRGDVTEAEPTNGRCPPKPPLTG
jgi:hypothetical protein